VASNQATSLSLAVNELATNAAKYGALSIARGRVDISWSTSPTADPTFEFIWRERGGPIVVKPTRQGFGSRVIEDFMASDFGGTVRLSHEPDGVVCELTAPLSNLPP
jgi:two-component sensor histidine kinase